MIAPTLYDHQKVMLDAVTRNRCWALFCEMGTGKTLVMLMLILTMPGTVTIVVCPKSVMYSWVTDIKKFTDLNYRVLTGTKAKRIKLMREVMSEGGIGIINYEGIATLGTTCAELKAANMVILDESSQVKNWKARRTRLINEVFKEIPHRYILSGTPITNNWLDLFSQLKFISPSIFGAKNFYAYRNRYCKMGGFKNYQIVGYKNTEELKGLVTSLSTQYKKEDCLDLPDKVYSTRFIEMSKEMQKQYDQMKKEMILYFNDKTVQANEAITKMLRLKQILAGEYINANGNEKLKALMGVITEQLDKGRQMVIWTHFRASHKIIRELLERNDIPYSQINGDTKDRDVEIDRFQEGKTKVFVGSITACGMGVTLTAGDLAVYYENTFNLGDRRQSEDRIHRIGQERVCNVVDLVYRDSVDEHVLQAIEHKQNYATVLVDSFKKGTYLKENVA